MRTSPLVSLGYEGRDVDELIRELKSQSVTVLVDVRLTPLSRKPGLSKKRLGDRLAAEGIAYVHAKALGNPKDNRQGFRAGDSSSLEVFQEQLATVDARHAIRHIAELMDGEVVALLCFERDHEECHRHMVADSILRELPRATLVKL